ncbi:MAG TPA: hypothetical protein VFV83_09315 [Chthoniobacteraceae bacterium]|nr:hypothetical protein [Chthoniobacteraceae bacterium]
MELVIGQARLSKRRADLKEFEARWKQIDADGRSLSRLIID